MLQIEDKAYLGGGKDGYMAAMAEWLEQASQWHGMHCHDLEAVSSSPGWVKPWCA